MTKVFNRVLSIGALCFLINCRDRNDYVLLTHSDIKKEYEIDTLERYPEKGLYLVGTTVNHAFGKFDFYYSIIKTRQGHKDLVYAIKDNRFWPRTSKEYISLVKPYPQSQWGWFCLHNNKAGNDLPGMDKILDTLNATKPKDNFIQETNGYIRFYLNGTIVKSLNYGHFITKFKDINFDSLDYNLYQLKGDSLVIVSMNGNDLLEQREGIFFVPPPGYGLIAKFNKQEIYSTIDSVSKLSSVPGIIKIKAIE